MKLIITLIFIFLLVFVAKAYYDTNAIEVRHYEIKDSSLGEVLAGLKVAFLSDFHIKSIGVRENKILEILNEEKPDLILLSGDYISFRGSYEPVMSFFHQLKPPYGVYAVLGNTEYSNENGSCILCHKKGSRSLNEDSSIKFLRNSFSRLKINTSILNIVGIDDPVEKKSDLKRALKGINPDSPSILLSHSPEIFEEASNYGIDFLLCGHTHGGQIFLTKYLRNIFPLEPALEFIEGFFQKGRTLMYVNRGIGTSYLPFRLGVKPEITFFNFLNNSTNQIDQTNLSRMPCNEYVRGEMRPALWSVETTTWGSLFHWDPINPTNSNNPSNPNNPINTVSISNNPPKTIFTGLSLSNLIETFNLLNIFDSLRSTAAPQNSNTSAQKILYDFESDSDLKGLNWECHKWFELSKENATSGKYSLKVSLPPGQYPGINFQEIKNDLSKSNYFKMDVFNPLEERIIFHIRIDDNKSGWEYADRFDINFMLKQGMNHISIPADSIRTNIYHRPLNLKKIKRMMVFLPNNPKQREIYIDHVHLE